MIMEEKICYAIIYLAEALIAWQFFGGLFPRRRSFTALCALYTFGYFIAYIFFTVSLVWVNTTVFALCNLAILLLGYTVKLKEALLHSVLLTGLMLGTEFLMALILGAAFQGYNQYQSDLTVLILFSVFSKLIYYFCTLLYVRIAKGKEPDSQISGPMLALLVICCISSILVIIALFYICLAERVLGYPEKLFLIAGGLGILFVNILLFAAYQYTQQLNKKYRDVLLLRQKDAADEEYYTALKEQYDNQRVLIHDIHHHLEAIKGLAAKEDLPDVAEYVGKVEQLPALQKQIRYCSDPALNAIIVRYHDLCRKRGILFVVDVRKASLSFMEPTDVTALFGNLLENAVEAAGENADASIEFSLDYREAQGLVMVTVTNSCKERPEQDDKESFFTHKADRQLHGIGLQSVRRTVKKYNGYLEQYYAEEAGMFHSIVTFPFERM